VLERDDRPGGLLMYGIPNMKLEKEEVVIRRLRLLEQEGIKFLCNANVGENVEAQLLLRDFDAVILATGATQPRDLNVPGREHAGIHFAMAYLTASTKAVLASDPDGTAIHARGKDVVIIGGGDTGTDCVATAMRHGCRSLTQLEILAKPPLDRADDNPWPEWPRVYRLDYGQEEAAARFGADPRRYTTTVKRFLADEAGQVSGVVTVQVSWQRNRKGWLDPREVEGSEQTIPTQLVLLAMGFLGPEQDLLAELGADTDARSNVAAEHGQFATNVPGLFAAGDCRRGQSLIVWAINEGRGAAREVDRYLMGSTDLP
jgi:glutamate synthase (NADPH/NADH) small chain